jgi:hypothetical protein
VILDSVILVLLNIDPQMINNLRLFLTAQEILNYLKRIYNPNSAAKHFQLKVEISKLQGNLFAQEYSYGFLEFADKKTLLLYMLFPRLLLQLFKRSTILLG